MVAMFKVVIIIISSAKIKYIILLRITMIGILLPFLIPMILLEAVSLILILLFVPLYLLGSVASQSSAEMAVSLAGFVGLMYYFLRS